MIAPRTSALFAVLPVLAVLSACSSTPQAALDQANNGTSLMVAMHGEINKFKAEQAAISRLRVDAIKQAQADMARMHNISADDDRIYAAAGRKNITDNMGKIIGLVDARAKDEQLLDERIADIDKTLGGLLTPLPTVDKELREAEKSLAILGNEMSSSERLKNFAAFAKDIKASVDANKKKIEEAKKASLASVNN